MLMTARRLTFPFPYSIVQVLLGILLSAVLLAPSQQAFAAEFNIEADSKSLTDIELNLKRKRYDEKKLKE